MKWLCLLILVQATLGQNGVRLPAEWEPHQRTFVCFPGSEIWPENLTEDVRADIARIASSICPFEEVVMLASPEDVEKAQSLVDPRVKVVPMRVDDLWARDTLPVFVEKTTDGEKRVSAVNFNFNGWGRKQYCENDARVAEQVTSLYNLDGVRSKIIAEGGSFETDGRGTLLVTESSLVNSNRSTLSKPDIEHELKTQFGVEKVIWFTGVRGQDITDGHVDCLVKYIGPNKVILNRPFPGSTPDDFAWSSDEAYEILSTTKDARGNSFEIIPLYEPDPSKIIYKGNRKTFLSSYVNFLIGDKFVLLPKFGDVAADAAAVATLTPLFPDKEIIAIYISAVASGGGGIHCATHDQPRI